MPTLKDLQKLCTGIVDPNVPKDPTAPPGTEKFCAYVLDFMQLGKKYNLTPKEVVEISQIMLNYTTDE